MSSRGIVRAVGLVVAITGVLAAMEARADGPVVVVGTGVPAQDVPAVQAAVDEGGIVILRGTFDFGTHAGNHIIVPGRSGSAQDVRGQSTVFIYQNDVTILGETDAWGNLLTTIRNGMPAFWIGWDGNVTRVQPAGTANVDYGIESLPVDENGLVNYRDTGPEVGYQGPQTRYALAYPNVSATVQHIDFESPWHYGVKATAGRNIAVLDNVFRDVQWGGLVHLNNFASATHIAAASGALGSFYAPFIAPAVTGTLVIEGNLVENVGIEPIDTHWGEVFGLLGLGTNTALSITGNDVRNVGRNRQGVASGAWAASIMLIDNFGGAPLISDNTIDNSSNVGIWDVTASYSSPGALIIDNTIVNCPVGIDSGSWYFPKSGVVIRSNRISQDRAFRRGDACIHQYNASSYYIGQNVLSGPFVEGVRLENASGNVIVWNDAFALRTPNDGSTYYLDETSCDNMVRGSSGTVVTEAACENDIVIERRYRYWRTGASWVP